MVTLMILCLVAGFLFTMYYGAQESKGNRCLLIGFSGVFLLVIGTALSHRSGRGKLQVDENFSALKVGVPYELTGSVAVGDKYAVFIRKHGSMKPVRVYEFEKVPPKVFIKMKDKRYIPYMEKE